MEVNSIFDSSFDEIDSLCVTIGRPNKNRNQQHIGLLYTDSEGETKFLHLAWHFALSNDKPDNKFIWLDIPLDPLNKIHLASMCQTIYESNQDGIPYGLCIEGTGFAKDGTFTAEEQYAGLTCATFVIRFFHSQGFSIIDLEQWNHLPDDKVWQRQILQLLEGHASKEHIDAQRIKIQKGAARFKPEVVAAAVTLPSPPHDAEHLTEPANKILAEVIKHAQKYATKSTQ